MSDHNPQERPHAEKPEELGLNIDMLDVDRLRQWANNLLVHDPNISEWGVRYFVAGKLQTIATGMEKEIRDVGALRSLVADLASALKGLHAEVRAMVGLIEPEMRAAAGNSNVSALLYHADEASALLARVKENQ